MKLQEHNKRYQFLNQSNTGEITYVGIAKVLQLNQCIISSFGKQMFDFIGAVT